MAIRSSRLDKPLRYGIVCALIFLAAGLASANGEGDATVMTHYINTENPQIDQELAEVMSAIPGFEHRIVFESYPGEKVPSADDIDLVGEDQPAPSRFISSFSKVARLEETVSESSMCTLSGFGQIIDPLGTNREYNFSIQAHSTKKNPEEARRAAEMAFITNFIDQLQQWPHLVPILTVYEIRKGRVILDGGRAVRPRIGEEFASADGEIHFRIAESRGQYAWADVLRGNPIQGATGFAALDRIGFTLTNRTYGLFLVEEVLVWDGITSSLEYAPSEGFESLRPVGGIDLTISGTRGLPLAVYGGAELPWRWGGITVESAMTLGFLTGGSTMELTHGRLMARIGISFEVIRALAFSLDGGFMIAPAFSEDYRRMHGALLGLGLHLKI